MKPDLTKQLAALPREAAEIITSVVARMTPTLWSVCKFERERPQSTVTSSGCTRVTLSFTRTDRDVDTRSSRQYGETQMLNSEIAVRLWFNGSGDTLGAISSVVVSTNYRLGKRGRSEIHYLRRQDGAFNADAIVNAPWNMTRLIEEDFVEDKRLSEARNTTRAKMAEHRARLNAVLRELGFQSIAAWPGDKRDVLDSIGGSPLDISEPGETGMFRIRVMLTVDELVSPDGAALRAVLAQYARAKAKASERSES